MGLLESVKRGDANAVRKLLEGGDRVNEADCLGWTALHHACFHDRLDNVRVLIDFQADVNATANNGWTPLHLACRYSKDKSLLEFLLAQGADPLILTNDGRSILYFAASKGNLIGISFALQFCDVNLRDKDGKTPLYYGVHENASIDALQLLLDAGADPEIRNNTNYKTAIDLAVYYNRGQDVIDLLRRNSKNAHERCGAEDDPMDVDRPNETFSSSSPRLTPTAAPPPSHSEHDMERMFAMAMEKVKSEMAEQNLCSICMDEQKNTALDCGHIFCRSCSDQVSLCPTCRRPIHDRRPVYL